MHRAFSLTLAHSGAALLAPLACGHAAAASYLTLHSAAAVPFGVRTRAAGGALAIAGAAVAVPAIPAQARGFRKKYTQKNTQGSNAYRRKRALDKAQRSGIGLTPTDLPIQTVTDPKPAWSSATATTAAKPSVPRTQRFVPPPPPPPPVAAAATPSVVKDAVLTSDPLPASASAAICCGCGAAFQSSYQDAPGFLPPDQFEKYVARRMQLFEGAREAEAKKREIAAAKERATRNARAASSKNPAPSEVEAAAPIDEEATDATTETAVDNSSAVDANSEPSSLPSAAASTSKSHALPAGFHRQAKLDPSRPLSEQDLTLALNHGFLDTDDPEALLAHGISPDMIMTKRELNQIERAQRDRVRDARGEAALRCLRCFQLANYGYTKGQVATVRADDFRTLLRSRFLEKGGKSCVILKVVDLFDFHGSFIRDFASVVGARHPIILVANKLDLLPAGFGETRVRAWIKAEAERYGLHFHSIELVSALTGAGLRDMLRHAAKLAAPDTLTDRPRRDIYIVGTTNVGKSSIVNALIEKRLLTSKGQFEATKIRPEEIGVPKEKAREQMREGEVGAKTATAEPTDATPSDDATTDASPESKQPMYLSAAHFMQTAPADASDAHSLDLLHASFNVLGGKMTASIVPGTTLGMVSFPFMPQYDPATGRRRDPIQHVLYDTPGVINPDQIAHRLTYHELRECMPRRQIQPLTYRITRGQCLLLGGLARLDFVAGERDYCFFTVFAARNVTVHITQIEKLDAVPKVKPTKQLPSATNDVDPTDNGTTSSNTDTTAPATNEAASSEPESEPEIGYLEFIKKHGGTRIYPPFTPERCREIGLHKGTRVTFDLHGRGWLDACEDIVFPGLGWISITGSGEMSVRAHLPGEVRAYAREPLMPFDARATKKKFTGSAVRQH